ncbi:ABC transporter permease [Ideonella sp. BN130291]|uniref:ABC transporter permease n=1 Tax=Ideonella sp. BN130291 TaxID=3112940 RepID=UPI002E25ED0F|nr:ABC transporter permease [Ideonella sp. BN130291]
MMREVITRFGRENLGVLWLIGEPALFTLGVAALWSAAGLSHGSGIPIVAFAITGYSSVLMWRNTASKCNAAISQNFNLLYHRNVQVVDLFITRILLELAGATASFMLLSVLFISLNMMKPPVDMMTVIGGWLMLAWFGASLGLLLGSAMAYSELVDRVWHPTSYLLFPLSGAAFMVEWLPKPAQQVVLLLPMVHGVEMVREGFFGNTVKTHYDIPYMAAICLVMNLVGLFLARDASRRVQAP